MGWINIHIRRRACFVAETSVCLHEELKRLRLLQLPAEKERSVVRL